VIRTIRDFIMYSQKKCEQKPRYKEWTKLKRYEINPTLEIEILRATLKGISDN
jgi:hypothetical protein